MYDPTRSDARTKIAPTKPAAKWPIPLFLVTLDAIGPDKKATQAIGPETQVAKADNMSAHKIRPSLVEFIDNPKVIAWASPN